MAKKSLINKQVKRVYLFSKFLITRNLLKKNLRSSSFIEDKLFYCFKMQKLPLNSSSSRLFRN